MSLYYCYLLDQKDSITAREILEGSDDTVMTKARQYLAGHPAIPGVELWLGDRFLGKLHQFTTAGYRLRAERCRLMSQTAQDASSRAALGSAAEQWDLLAELTEIHLPET